MLWRIVLGELLDEASLVSAAEQARPPDDGSCKVHRLDVFFILPQRHDGAT
jgi:hypothetical protein